MSCIEELEKGFLNSLIYGEEGYSVDEEGNLKCLTPEELEELKCTIKGNG